MLRVLRYSRLDSSIPSTTVQVSDLRTINSQSSGILDMELMPKYVLSATKPKDCRTVQFQFNSGSFGTCWLIKRSVIYT